MSDLVRARLAAQGLSGPPARTPEAVVRRLLAVQAQDARGARLAVRSRSIGLRAADVDAALTERRSMVVTWSNRGTLHLVAAEDYPWFEALTTPRLAAGNVRRLREEGVSEEAADTGVRTVLDAVHREGPLTREQLRSRLDAAGVPTGGQALVHVLVAATLAGRLVRGPLVDGDHAFVDAESWLGASQPTPHEEAVERLARRYLEGHGPATAADLARWAGVPLGTARRGLDAIGAELVSVSDDLVALATAPPPGDLPEPRLLGMFDPILHGWVSREPLVGTLGSAVISGGVFRATALVGGRVAATWSLNGDVLTVRPLVDLPAATRDALRDDGAEVFRFLGLGSGNVEFDDEG